MLQLIDLQLITLGGSSKELFHVLPLVILFISLFRTICNVSLRPSSTQASPAQIEGVSVYSPCLFGKGIVVHARHTCEQQTLHLLKQTLSETIKPIDNSCMLSPNPSINPVVC